MWFIMLFAAFIYTWLISVARKDILRLSCMPPQLYISLIIFVILPMPRPSKSESISINIPSVPAAYFLSLLIQYNPSASQIIGSLNVRLGKEQVFQIMRIFRIGEFMILFDQGSVSSAVRPTLQQIWSRNSLIPYQRNMKEMMMIRITIHSKVVSNCEGLNWWNQLNAVQPIICHQNSGRVAWSEQSFICFKVIEMRKTIHHPQGHASGLKVSIRQPFPTSNWPFWR